MARIDLSKLKKKARSYFADRKYRQAIEVLEQLQDHEPERPRWPHKLGEAYKRSNKPKEAIPHFQLAASLYSQQGFPIKAMALAKMILAIDPEHAATKAMMSRLCQERSAAAPPPPRTPSIPLPDFPRASAIASSPPSAAPPQLIPKGKSLDIIDLRQLPAARRQPAEPDHGAAFEIPIDEDPATATRSPTELLSRIPPTPLLSDFDNDSLRALVERTTVRTFEADDVIISQRGRGDSLFLLVEGEVGVYREGPTVIELDKLQEGAFFGEIAVLTDRPRSATVKALSDVMVLEISRDVISEVIAEHPIVLTVMLRFFRERLIDTLVDTSRLFAPFAGPDRLSLVERFNFIEAEPNCYLLKNGERADGLYILLCGSAEAVRPDGTIPSRLGTGDMFGMSSLLTNEPSMIDIRSMTKCWLLKLPRTTFAEVIMTHPHVLEVVSELVAEQSPQESELHLLIV